jgi:hypothetical protein
MEASRKNFFCSNNIVQKKFLSNFYMMRSALICRFSSFAFCIDLPLFIFHLRQRKITIFAKIKKIKNEIINEFLLQQVIRQFLL